MRTANARGSAERTLRSNEEKFRRAFDLNPGAMSMTRLKDGVFLAVNQGSDNVCKYDPNDAGSVATIPIGPSPYTYSDFTGNALFNVTCSAPR